MSDEPFSPELLAAIDRACGLIERLPKTALTAENMASIVRVHIAPYLEPRADKSEVSNER